MTSSTALIYVRELEVLDAGPFKGETYYTRCRVHLWNETAFVKGESTLLVEYLTNGCTLVKP